MLSASEFVCTCWITRHAQWKLGAELGRNSKDPWTIWMLVPDTYIHHLCRLCGNPILKWRSFSEAFYNWAEELASWEDCPESHRDTTEGALWTFSICLPEECLSCLSVASYQAIFKMSSVQPAWAFKEHYLACESNHQVFFALHPTKSPVLVIYHLANRNLNLWWWYVLFFPPRFSILYIHCFVYTVYDDFGEQWTYAGHSRQSADPNYAVGATTETNSAGRGLRGIM